MNPYSSSTSEDESVNRVSKKHALLFGGALAMAMLSLWVLGRALFTILSTTPFMGVLVDAEGNRIRVEGYAELILGLAGLVAFVCVASVLGIKLKR